VILESNTPNSFTLSYIFWKSYSSKDLSVCFEEVV